MKSGVLYKYKDYEFDTYRHKTATEDQITKALDWMGYQVGKHYDYLGILGIVLSMVHGTKTNELDQKNSYWCSELIADGFINAGIMLCVEPQTWKVSPQDLAECGSVEKIQ